MVRSIIAIICTLVVGTVCMEIGLEFLGGFPEFGSIAAVAVASGCIIYFNEKRK